MTDHDLANLLERSAERISIGAPPVSEMLVRADRLRRRRSTTRAVVAAAAVVAVIGGTALVAAQGSDPSGGSLDGPADTQPAEPIPAGTRLVGIGHSAIAVPEDWATNALRCGTATEPTVVVDVTVIETCGWLSPEVFDNVWVEQGVNRNMFSPAEDFEIDGVAAQRDETSCTAYGDRVRQCSGTVFVPSANASYRAQAATKQRVEEILSWIHIVPDRVAVPGFGPANMDHQDDDAGEHYRAELQAAGLQVEVITEPRPGFKPGYVLGVSPGPGTMVEPGDVVSMTEIAEPRGPADEVHVEVNSVGPGDSMDYRGLSDEQIRAGAEIRIDLGATIWIYGHGKRIGTLGGEVSGSALTLDDWKEGPNYGRSWTAVERGTSTLTISITAYGTPITLGTVTVIVA
ncbi:PASTA domain-containing protein [Nocardioides pakistanensis]